MDLAGRTVLPGLIDLHLHLNYYYHRKQASDYNDARIALLGTVHLAELLDAGITSVRDVGSSGHLVFDLKWALGEGLIRGPRIRAAGRIIVPTGGHGSKPGDLSLEFDGPAAARGAVREEIKAGADLIKIGVLEDEWSLDELEAAVDQAHRMKRRVACHVNYPPSITNALKAGVDSIEHGCLVTDEELARMRDQGTWWVITALIYRAQFDKFKEMLADPETPTEVRAQAEAQARRHEWIWDNMPGAIRRAAEMGVRIGIGTDQLYPEYGIACLARDMEMLVDIGLSPMQVLQAATSGAAECLGCDSDLGTVEAGQLADVIAVGGDPLADISAMKEVVCVIKDGRVEKCALGDD